LAVRESTSPACAPRMPSATTNTGARANALSSLSRRWRPVSVLQVVSAARSIVRVESRSSLVVGKLAVADPDSIARVQRLRAVERLVVQISAVGGSQILYDEDVPLLGDAGVARGREWVIKLDLDVSAAESSARVGNFVCHSGRMTVCALDQEPWLELIEVPVAQTVGRGVHTGGIWRWGLVRGNYGRAAPEISERAPDNPDQEQG